MSRSPSIGRASALMGSGTAASRVLGLLRSIALAAAIGATGQAADAFAVANKLPNILYQLLAGGALNAVLVPQVVRAYKRRAGQQYVDRLLTLGFAVLAGTTLLLTIAAPLLVLLYADAGNREQMVLATTFAYWCIPQMFFYGVYGLLGQVLNARESFGPYMWAPVVNNIVAIAGCGLFIVMFGSSSSAGGWSGAKVAVLAGSATLGIVAQALVLFPALTRAGVRFRLRWGVRGTGLGRAGSVAMWTFAGLGVGQLAFIVQSRIASAAPEAFARAHGLTTVQATTAVAGNAAYDYAFLVFILPHSLVTVSLMTALFTRLSAQATDRDRLGVRDTLSTGLRALGLFTIPTTVIVGLLALPVVRLIIWHPHPGEIAAVGGVTVAMVLGLPVLGIWSMCQRVYYAYEDARSMLAPQIVMAVVIVVGTLLGWLLAPPQWWVAVSALAVSLSYVIGTLMALRHVHWLIGSFDGSRVLRLHLRATLASVAALVVGVPLLLLLGAGAQMSLVAALLKCVVVGGAMVTVYVLVLRAMHVPELEVLAGPVRSVLARFPGRRPGRPD
ncbi:murein biosynthesis integral membrane protein MurJ [Cellulomonas sp. SG140]|uniref:murein biosynthesis integral membrane protein MurJ n=1 Tax=Cellulomonas sp. SG140 TaxID=2976536 RepID=UPI0021E6DC22|nr:murein biosynthesis integral membrane protein MurJ [Cellulomonas sp. SG140]